VVERVGGSSEKRSSVYFIFFFVAPEDFFKQSATAIGNLPEDLGA